jgi:hypothetical protein
LDPVWGTQGLEGDVELISQIVPEAFLDYVPKKNGITWQSLRR